MHMTVELKKYSHSCNNFIALTFAVESFLKSLQVDSNINRVWQQWIEGYHESFLQKYVCYK